MKGLAFVTAIAVALSVSSGPVFAAKASATPKPTQASLGYKPGCPARALAWHKKRNEAPRMDLTEWCKQHPDY